MTQQRYVIRLADGTLDKTEGEIDVYDSYSEALDMLNACQGESMIADTYVGAEIEMYIEEE